MENKTSKYFKYAIGEIVLVVIGILIALQINNWNEKQKTDTSGQKLAKELYLEYESAGESIRSSYDGIKVYTTFLENVIRNWKNLDFKSIDTLNKNIYAKEVFSTTFYLASYSQFNDPRKTIYQKAINDGTINIANPDFIAVLENKYEMSYRLNEMIAQEYELGKEINLHIAQQYGHILVDLEEENPDLDKETLNKLIIEFRKDGTLKYLIKSRLDVARIRMFLLQSIYEETSKDLIEFKFLKND